MNFAEWQSLTPEAAARELHARVRTRLSPAQQRAALAWLAPEGAVAERIAQARARRTGSALAGVPYAAKDLFDVAGLPTLAGSTFLPEVRGVATRDAALVTALADAGAALVAKTHLHEFAYGITGENPHYGDCAHPRFPDRTTGGSSSGSAALVAAGVVPLALGTDTGGSVRVPAAFCGLYGFRLTPRDAWIRDAFPLAPSFDTAGWFTANAPDLLATCSALVGVAPAAGAPRGCYFELPGLDPDVAAACQQAAERFAPPADAVTRAELEHGFAGALEAYHTTVASEAWQVHRAWADRFHARYDPQVWLRLSRAHALTAGQLRAAEETRAAIRAQWSRYFEAFDFLLLPATPTAALTKAGCTLENRNRLIMLTAPASIGGRPVVTIPIPLPSGLTTGLQVVVRDTTSPVIAWALAR